MSLYEQVKERIRGRIAMNAADAAVLVEQVIQAGDADTCEIGTLYGGSAILAALAKRENGLGGQVYAIDPLDGYYGGHDTVIGGRPGRDELERNLKEFGVEDIVVIVQARSHPWPLPAEQRFGLVFVDGDHTEDGVYQDWTNARQVTGRVLFHDYHNPKTRSALLRAIENETGLLLEALSQKMALMRRRDD